MLRSLPALLMLFIHRANHQVKPGDVVKVNAGVYQQNNVMNDCSGTPLATPPADLLGVARQQQSPVNLGAYQE